MPKTFQQTNRKAEYSSVATCDSNHEGKMEEILKSFAAAQIAAEARAEAALEAAEVRHQEQMELLRQQLQPAANAPVLNSAVQKAKNLAETMVVFSYDPDSNQTFDAWYKRYEPIFTTDVADWTDAAKIRLLLQKFAQPDYQKFADAILPEMPTELTLAAAVKELKRIFGYRETKFALRHKCFNLKKEDSESFVNYSTRINKHGEKFDVKTCTADDFKVLLFVSGLKGPHDAQILEKLLSKVDTQHKEIELAAGNVAALEAIKKLTLHDLVNEAERLLSLKSDKQEVRDPPSSQTNEVFAVQRPHSGKKSSPSTQQTGRAPKSPCRFCGGSHWERDCDHVNKACETCKNVGHKSGFCSSAMEAAFKSLLKSREAKSKVNQVKSRLPSKRKYVTPFISGVAVKLQLDSGADVTIITEDNWKKLGQPSLVTCRNPDSASGDQIPMKGSFTCHMTLGKSEDFGTCYVTDRPNINLLGNDWIEALGLYNTPLASVFHIKMGPDENALKREAGDKFPSLFAEGLGLCTKSKVALTLKAASKPVFRKARNVPIGAEKDVEAEIKRQQEMGVFTPVAYSDFAAPIVVVRKSNGKIRICGDYSTGLNDSLEPNKFPLPTIDHIVANMAGKKIFSKIDLSDAFLQLELDDDAKKLLTVNTHRGLFQVNRMQPGVKTAPGAFQELMCKMLSGVDGAFAFIDDIILGAANEKEHKVLLFAVLRQIQDYGFKLRIEKCEFGKTELLFCGHVINADGTRPNPEMIAKIQELPRPTDVSGVRSFLGAVNYYGKYVRSMKDYRAPLDDLMKKDVRFEWQQKHEDAFLRLKEVMSSKLVLTHYDPSKKIVVASDCSSYGKGGAVMHEFADGSLHPFIHFSSSLNAAEKNYSQIEREACAADFVLKRARPYIYGRKFEFHIDHKPLLAIFGSKKGIPAHSASRLQRYALNMLGYEFDIKYVNTESFGYADIVSRLIASQPRAQEETVIATVSADNGEIDDHCYEVKLARELPVKFEDLQQATGQCATLKTVTEYIMKGWPNHKRQIRSDEVTKYFDQRHSLSIRENCIFFGERIVIPKAYRQQILQELHEGHPGILRTKLLARSKVWWPKIDDDIQRTVQSCGTCATTGNTPIKCTLKSWPQAKAPWSRIHADYAGPMDGQFFLVIVDAYSKWPEVFRTSSTTSKKTIELMQTAFAFHGLPDKLVTDNGPQFASQEFAVFCQENGIEHIRSAPYHPQSNGQAEKFVDLLKTGLEKAQGTWNEKLNEFLMHYRSTPSTALDGKSPAEARFGFKMSMRIDRCKPHSDPPAQRNESMEAQFNAAHGAKWKEFEVNMPVYYKLHKSNKDWHWIPATITKRTGSVNYSIKTEAGKSFSNAHANQLKFRHEPATITDDLNDVSGTDDDHFHTDRNRRGNENLDETAVNQEDDYESAEDNSFQELPPAEPAEPRRTARNNAGVPPQRYGWVE